LAYYTTRNYEFESNTYNFHGRLQRFQASGSEIGLATELVSLCKTLFALALWRSGRYGAILLLLPSVAARCRFQAGAVGVRIIAPRRRCRPTSIDRRVWFVRLLFFFVQDNVRGADRNSRTHRMHARQANPASIPSPFFFMHASWILSRARRMCAGFARSNDRLPVVFPPRTDAVLSVRHFFSHPRV
jgi:hypothetical protein